MSEEAAVQAYVERARKAVGDTAVAMSCMHDEPWKLFDGKHFNTILEIGTCYGLSAMMLAHYSEVVITIDVVRHPLLEPTLAAFSPGVLDHISFIHVRDDHDKRLLVNALDFDMAFIDGRHTQPACELDFLITRKCGSVLFHDYPCSSPNHRGVGLVVDAITEGTVERMPPFAWWTADPKE